MKNKIKLLTVLLILFTLVGCSEVNEVNDKNVSTNNTVKKGDGWEFTYDEKGNKTELEIDDNKFKTYLMDNMSRFVDIEHNLKSLKLEGYKSFDFMYSYDGYQYITLELEKDKVINESISELVYFENIFRSDYIRTYSSAKSHRSEYMGKTFYDMYIKQDGKVYKISGKNLVTVFENEFFKKLLEDFLIEDYNELLNNSASVFEGIRFYE